MAHKGGKSYPGYKKGGPHKSKKIGISKKAKSSLMKGYTAK